jgi:hypothetical protein
VTSLCTSAIAIFSVLPYALLRSLLFDAEQERHRENLEKLLRELRDDECSHQ